MAVNTKIPLENLVDGYLAEAKTIKGTLVAVSTQLERDSINHEALVNGSICYVSGNSKFYKWNGTTWVDGIFTREEIQALLSTINSSINGKQDEISDLNTIRSGAALGATALQSESDPTVPSWAKQTNKPTYTAVEVGAVAISEKGAANGVATLDSNGLVTSTQLPSYVDDVIEAYVRSGATEYCAVWLSLTNGGEFLVPEQGKIYVIVGPSSDSHLNKQYRWSGTQYTLCNPSDVNSVNGQTGIVVLNKNNLGLNNVDNTSDLSKPISSATQSALDNKANSSDIIKLTNSDIDDIWNAY